MDDDTKYDHYTVYFGYGTERANILFEIIATSNTEADIARQWMTKHPVEGTPAKFLNNNPSIYFKTYKY